MSDQHLKRTPHNIAHDQDVWWYEEPAGICVVQKYRDNTGVLHGTRSVVIPWRSLRAAMKRKAQP